MPDQAATKTNAKRTTASTLSRFLTVAEFIDELQIARSTFDEWRAKGIGPNWLKLPNGQLRCLRVDYERWINSLEGAA